MTDLQPVPDPEPAAPRTVEVEVTGGTVTMLASLSGEDFLALWQLTELDTSDDGALLRMYGPIMAMIERHTVSHTLDAKPILARGVPVLIEVWRGWNEGLRADALDPTTASGSPSRSQRRR